MLTDDINRALYIESLVTAKRTTNKDLRLPYLANFSEKLTVNQYRHVMTMLANGVTS